MCVEVRGGWRGAGGGGTVRARAHAKRSSLRLLSVLHALSLLPPSAQAAAASRCAWRAAGGTRTCARACGAQLLARGGRVPRPGGGVSARATHGRGLTRPTKCWLRFRAPCLDIGAFAESRGGTGARPCPCSRTSGGGALYVWRMHHSRGVQYVPGRRRARQVSHARALARLQATHLAHAAERRNVRNSTNARNARVRGRSMNARNAQNSMYVRNAPPLSRARPHRLGAAERRNVRNSVNGRNARTAPAGPCRPPTQYAAGVEYRAHKAKYNAYCIG